MTAKDPHPDADHSGQVGQDEQPAGRRETLPTPDSRRAAVEQTAGALTGVYEADELRSLREEWPA